MNIDKKNRSDTIGSKSKHSVFRTITYIIGSISLATIACITLPTIMKKGTATLYKFMNHDSNNKTDDDWGLEIVKKSEIHQTEGVATRQI